MFIGGSLAASNSPVSKGEIGGADVSPEMPDETPTVILLKIRVALLVFF
jgi:hypothetical protein